jgi:hypothetical protein
MEKFVKQNSLYDDLENILPTQKQLNFETRNARPEYIENLRAAQAKIKNDPIAIANKEVARLKKQNSPNWKLTLQQGIDKREQERRSNTERLVYTPFGIFNAAVDAARAINVPGSTLLFKLKNDPGYFYFNKSQLDEIDNLIEKDKKLKDELKKLKKDPKKYSSMAKPLQTPFGIFFTLGECYSFVKENKIMLDPGRKIPKFIKNDCENYYHISKEEYTRLTGKEL